ncbi:MAG: hypothetical protein ABI691_10635 [Ginsengibacter sp.]
MIDLSINIVFFEKAILFLDEIGIETAFEMIDNEDCFLPGFTIKNGKIIIDRNKIKFHGDILHEAAHIAVVPAEDRMLLNGKNIGSRKDAAAEEMMAIAWSYAACIHLKIDAHFVFHENGYKGGGGSIVENFNNGNYIGVPVLQWLGMTSTQNEVVYPVMIKWLRD